MDGGDIDRCRDYRVDNSQFRKYFDPPYRIKHTLDSMSELKDRPESEFRTVIRLIYRLSENMRHLIVLFIKD